jgi:signal transduction histidine kinase
LHIAEEHGGRIFFENVGDLTTFSIQLPIDRRHPIEALAARTTTLKNRFPE